MAEQSLETGAGRPATVAEEGNTVGSKGAHIVACDMHSRVLDSTAAVQGFPEGLRQVVD